MREKILETGLFFCGYFPTVAFFTEIRQWFLDREESEWWHRIGCGGGVDREVV
jgi:hypothetical protein